jgi:tripartite-type tricarboxylate transporter receptor subunit TctC
MRGLCAVLATLLWGIAAAQDFPSRTVHFVVPYTPGTGADILARLLGARLAERWKVAVVVENKAGATGVIGTELAAKSAPDGHTLLFVATSFATTPALARALPFDPVKSFAPVALAATSALVVVASPQLGARSVRELVEAAKREPGRLHYASPGAGGIQHLAMELVKLETGMNLVHVPYKGAAGALADVAGGHVQATIAAAQTAHPHVAAGKLRALGVMSAQRLPAFPGVPTLAEQGLPALEVETWYGAFAPAGTPPAVVSRINGDLDALLGDTAVRELLARQGMSAAGGPPGRLGELVRRELERWARVVQAAGIRAD